MHGSQKAPRFAIVLGLALVALLGSVGGVAAQPSQDLVLAPGVEAHGGIDAIYARFTQGYKDLDAPRVAALYTEDALYLSPGGEIRQGRAAIEQGFARSFSRTWNAGETLHIRFEIVDRGIEGALAYDVGYYHLNRTDKAGEVRTSTGKFVVVIHCEGPQGPCLFHVDGYSDVRPTPPATPPAATPDTDPQPDGDPNGQES